MARSSFVAKLCFLLGGLLIWGFHFLFVYGVNGLACARGGQGNGPIGSNVVPLIVALATAIAVLVAATILVVALRGRGPGIADEPDPAVRDFWRFGAAVIAAFGIIAVTWTGLPALFIAPCA